MPAERKGTFFDMFDKDLEKIKWYGKRQKKTFGSGIDSSVSSFSCLLEKRSGNPHFSSENKTCHVTLLWESFPYVYFLYNIF